MEISFELNGKSITCQVTSKITLLRLLRDELKLTGSKNGCEKGDCGACSVIVDGELKNACIYPARNLDGKKVLTIEGVANPDGSPNDLQQAFLEYGGTQCGYCTPGMIVAGEALLLNNQNPTRTEIREAIGGNLCRCTGYHQIVDAIEATAIKRRNRGAK
ncbi:MAG: (2Fe-2S)-binding protein [Chloroflexi bacterium]|nr:(2Fe-2S)-binding protein [Chloroflexota bacterium]MBL6966413.1 (2Fe-2S)-binding protein [Anaerolineales bacterium]